MIGLILSGCSSNEPKPEPSVPSTSDGRAEWATTVAELNRVEPSDSYTISLVAGSICEHLQEGLDPIDVVVEVAKIKGFSLLEAAPLIGIAIYGYCPQYKEKWKSWESSEHVDLTAY